MSSRRSRVEQSELVPGDKPVDTTAGGEPVVEHPEPGEVLWCDQVDALDLLTDEEVEAAADALTDGLLVLSPDAVVHRRLLSGTDRPDPA